MIQIGDGCNKNIEVSLYFKCPNHFSFVGDRAELPSGKIGKTRVIGADRVLKDFRNLIKALRRIERLGDRNARGSALQKASRGFRATVSQTVSQY